ncbi:glycosyltransferase family 2 protein [Photobacterium sp. MCCC 1A19761]|uniref:glycosyltransferase family 2 protein n=1 Tax=Photobacterium sp. MCCC 1A19761 TaxID=3115000 RepID=UPI00307F939B
MKGNCVFSLVVGVYGHKKEFTRFLDSLYDQSISFELIIVDQNPDDKISQMLESKYQALPWKHIKTGVKGLSHARNLGLEESCGDYVCFPDDDCFFTSGFLDKVYDRLISCNPNGLAVITKDPETNKPLSYTKRNYDFFIDTCDVFANITSISVFLKNTDLRFDEKFGIGGEFNSCEEIDYVYRYVKIYGGFNYTPDICVYHPSPLKLPFAKLMNKVFVNSQGHGAFFIKNFNLRAYIEHIHLRPFAGFIYHLLRLDLKKSLISLISLVSRNYGSIRFFISNIFGYDHAKSKF